MSTCKYIGNMLVKHACQDTVILLNTHIKLLKENNEIFRNNHRHKRGAFNIVGNIANSLFGLLDTEYTDQLATTIDTLRQNEQKLKMHAENLTTFMDRTLSIMKKTDDEIERNFQQIEELIKRMSDDTNNIVHELNDQKLRIDFTEVALQAFMYLTDFQNTQEAIMDIVMDAIHGKINSILLSPQELQKELDRIDLSTMKTTMLPFPTTDIFKFYRLMTISHRISSSYVIFNIRIPLTTTKNFELLKLTPIPWVTNNTIYKLQLSSPILLIDLLRDQFYPMSSGETEHCISVGKTFLCEPSQPLYNQHSQVSQCELHLLKESQITSFCQPIIVENESLWLPLLKMISWIFSVIHQELLNIVCNNIPSQAEISGSGIIKIGNDCVIRARTVSLEGHASITKERQVSYVPDSNTSTINEAQLIKGNNYTFRYGHHQKEIETLRKELNEFKTVSLNNIRPHDIHHYGISYTILFIILGVIIIFLMRYWKQKCVRKQPISQPAPRAHVPKDDNKSASDGESHIISIFNS